MGQVAVDENPKSEPNHQQEEVDDAISISKCWNCSDFSSGIVKLGPIVSGNQTWCACTAKLKDFPEK